VPQVPQRPQTVLAIDDTKDIHDLLRLRLRGEGVLLHHAQDAEEGLAMARTLVPDLVLLDVDMPRMNGFDVCKQMKSDPTLAGVPIIFLTAASDVDDKVAGLDLGAVDYVTKPFNTAELRARVRAALRTKRYQDMLAQRAQIDGLTGLWNRGYFEQRLSEEVAAAKRYGREVSLLLVDLDHFKKINDTHGHQFGDRVLMAASEVISACVRVTDTACRYGGEEIAVILTETGLDGARTCAARIREEIEKLSLASKGNPVVVTASIGLVCMASIANDALAPGALVEAADSALYAAKKDGRNRVCEA
jgi:diguanylate cyclase (GGDEF)-like protein